MGDLCRALGVALMLSLSRWRSFSLRYPLFSQLKSSLLRRRSPYPPPAGPPLSKLSCLASSASIGVVIGGMIANSLNLFLFPPALLTSIVSVATAYLSTLESCEGDLMRCAAMKVIGLLSLLWSSATETGVPSISLQVSRRTVSYLTSFNRKFKVTETILNFFSRLFNSFSENKRTATSPITPPIFSDEQ